jgi:hypothetical protein
MAHYCESALITCEDFRLHQRKDGRNYIAEFIKNLGMDCDLITRGGGVQDMVRPKERGYCDCLLRDAEVSAKLHDAKFIYLVNHEDCGAYGDMNFSSREEELEQHYKDLRAAKEIILENFPDKEVKLYFGELKEEPDRFEIKPIK